MSVCRIERLIDNVLTGTVTCSLRANHQFTCGRNETLQSCTLRCVQLQNASYVLLVHDRPYVLEGDASVLEHFAGGKATVVGPVHGDSVQVRFVTRPNTMTETLGTKQQPVTNASR